MQSNKLDTSQFDALRIIVVTDKGYQKINATERALNATNAV